MFRFIFGFMMLAGTIRFAANGWIHDLYILPKYHFTFYGFDWVQSWGDPGMYILFGIVMLSAFCIMIGFAYRLFMPVFFLAFTYIELIDKSTYLNHYYFISLISFLMIWVPANSYFSIDVWLKPKLKRIQIPKWTIGIIMAQMGLLYVFAGIAKLDSDWLFEALPLKIWLAPKTHLPIIGSLMDETWVAYFFSWFGCIYDLTIVFFLLNNRTRKWAYVAVVGFHAMTALLFPIGMFPYVMIVCTLVFFPAKFHLKWINRIRGLFGWTKETIDGEEEGTEAKATPIWKNKVVMAFLGIYFLIQIVLPFRYLLYPDNLFWTEQGYRFSWRVMLMEKAGQAFFYVKDPKYPGEVEIRNSDFLSPLQEKMMATQPDFILQYAKIIEEEYQKQGIADPIIRAEIWVALNGRGSRLYIDPTIDLTELQESFAHKDWILSYDKVYDLSDFEENNSPAEKEVK